MRLKVGGNYSRINNIIYEDGKPVIELLECSFIDQPQLTDRMIKYMNNYLNMFPNREGKIEPTMPKIKKVFFDCETTGTNFKKNSIHQLAGLIEIDDEVVHHFNYKVRPHPKAIIESSALAISGVTEEQIMQYPSMEVVYKQFIVLLSTYCDRYDKQDKMWLVGYNNRDFDDNFLRKFFELNNDKFFNAWFWPDTHDTMVLASSYLEKRRHKMSSFKLHRVAKELGLLVDESKLHDGVYDNELTREIYRIVTGREIEL